MKKKKLLGKIVSLVLAAALTVTALPTTGMEVQAAEQVQTETGTTEDESAQYKDEEKSEEAQSKEEEKTSEAESEEKTTENKEQDNNQNVPAKDDSVKSPVVENGKVTFNYYGHDKEQVANRVTVKGSMNNWLEHDMTYNASTGYWSVSMNNIAPGEYQYGFNYYGEEKTEWTLDPLNPNHVGDAGSNNVFWVEGLVSGNATAKKGETSNLPKTLKCYTIEESTGKGTSTDAEVTYALSTASEAYADKVVLDNSGDTPTINIASDLSTDVKELTLTATSKDNSDYT